MYNKICLSCQCLGHFRGFPFEIAQVQYSLKADDLIIFIGSFIRLHFFWFLLKNSKCTYREFSWFCTLYKMYFVFPFDFEGNMTGIRHHIFILNLRVIPHMSNNVKFTQLSIGVWCRAALRQTTCGNGSRGSSVIVGLFVCHETMEKVKCVVQTKHISVQHGMATHTWDGNANKELTVMWNRPWQMIISVMSSCHHQAIPLWCFLDIEEQKRALKSKCDWANVCWCWWDVKLWWGWTTYWLGFSIQKKIIPLEKSTVAWHKYYFILCKW